MLSTFVTFWPLSAYLITVVDLVGASPESPGSLLSSFVHPSTWPPCALASNKPYLWLLFGDVHWTPTWSETEAPEVDIDLLTLAPAPQWHLTNDWLSRSMKDQFPCLQSGQITLSFSFPLESSLARLLQGWDFAWHYTLPSLLPLLCSATSSSFALLLRALFFLTDHLLMNLRWYCYLGTQRTLMVSLLEWGRMEVGW